MVLTSKALRGAVLVGAPIIGHFGIFSVSAFEVVVDRKGCLWGLLAGAGGQPTTATIAKQAGPLLGRDAAPAYYQCWHIGDSTEFSFFLMGGNREVTVGGGGSGNERMKLGEWYQPAFRTR